MSRIWTAGYEFMSGNNARELSSWTSGVVPNTFSPKSGSYALRIQTNHRASYIIPSMANTFSGFWINMPTKNDSIYVVRFQEDGGNIACTLLFGNNNKFKLHRGSVGTLLAESPLTYPLILGEYVHLQIDYDPGSSPTATDGHFILKLDDSEIINYSGDVNGNDATVDRIDFSSSGNYTYIDDLIINDDQGGDNNTLPGVKQLEFLLPNAAGDLTQLNRGGTDTGNNYSQVNTIPIDANNVQDNVVDDADLYNLANTVDLPNGASDIQVTVNGIGQLPSGSGSGAMQLKSGAVTDEGPTHVLTGGETLMQKIYTLNPDGNVAWTKAAVDAIQVGPKVK